MAHKKVAAPSKYHGGKSSLADWIISLMPPRCKNPNPSPKDDGWLHYVEPYAGMANVALALDPNGISEVIGDTNGQLTNFWRVLRHDHSFLQFKRLCEATPFSLSDWRDAMRRPAVTIQDSELNVSEAHAYFVSLRQSLAGRGDTFASVSRNRVRRGMNEQVSAWLTSVEGLAEVHARIKRWLILTQSALMVINSEDAPRTLFYLDPTYLPETRATVGEYGKFEMSPDDHEALLTKLATIKGRFMLSGYRSKLYDSHAKKNKWKRHEKKIPNSAAGGKEKRIMTECCWTNF